MTARVFIPWPHRVDDDYASDGVYVTEAAVRDVLHSSHLHCTWEVTRGGQLEPCMKTAVAIRYDENAGELTEVCKAHAVRILVPLSFIAEVARADIATEDSER
jgi:hypothetical protein